MTVEYSAAPQDTNGFAPATSNNPVAQYPREQEKHLMDRGASEYSQPDQSSAAQYTPSQEVRAANFSSSATPTSEYSLNPSSARSSNFPEYVGRPPYQEGRYPASVSSSGDPSIATTSPTYPPPSQYSPYPAQQHEMAAQAYPGHPGAGGMYGRPEWPPYGQAQSHVYSFVPIPGSQQQKRPRRRYEEIERMYKCGWNGCEKAYGTLNHLNAHVTMQSHGQKRTPEEFKEIRKEWKARKKEEENQRKAEEERARAAAQASQVEAPQSADPAQVSSAGSYPPGVRPQLPPLGYSPAQPGQVQGHYAAAPPANGIDQMPQYNNSPLYSNYPQSPYGQNQMYQQRHTPLQVE